jgi:uncharacterized protein YjbK
MTSGFHNEVELKRLLVGNGAGDKLIAALGGEVRADMRQVNHIFDTDARSLDRSRYALRLRLEGPAAWLTAKGPTSRVGASTGSKAEAEAAVEPAMVRDLLAGRLDPLTVLKARVTDPGYADLWKGLEAVRGSQSLRSWGHFENRRRTVCTSAAGPQLDVEVDRTVFPNGRVDEEVEIELPREGLAPQVEKWLDATLRAAAIESEKSTPKIARFFASIGGSP